jgi:hypothetical protein
VSTDGPVHRDFWPGLKAEQLQEQIAIREAQIQQMVGWLYPSILRDEIRDLYLLKSKLKETKP